jgi:hypothetical protein
VFHEIEESRLAPVDVIEDDDERLGTGLRSKSVRTGREALLDAWAASASPIIPATR